MSRQSLAPTTTFTCINLSPSLTLALLCLQATREARREAQETEKRRKSTLPDNMPGMRKGSLTDSRAPPPCTPCTRTASAEQNQTRARVRRQGGLEGVGEGCYRAQRRRLTLQCVALRRSIDA